MLSFTFTPEQEQLKQTARDFTRKEIIPVAGRYDEAEEFPYDVMRKAWEIGLMNLEVPAEYGGLGLGVLDSILCLEEINYGCSGMATIIAVNDLASTPLLLAGDETQKREYLGRRCRGCRWFAIDDNGSRLRWHELSLPLAGTVTAPPDSAGIGTPRDAANCRMAVNYRTTRTGSVVSDSTFCVSLPSSSCDTPRLP